ncbi:hypothetical protein ACH4VT_33570 [Streptomyces lydicus]|uniref:hypothetical protein n=1 Tax=Streptomyces lydicus TaxID=47763 RepID=UPI0037AACB28
MSLTAHEGSAARADTWSRYWPTAAGGPLPWATGAPGRPSAATLHRDRGAQAAAWSDTGLAAPLTHQATTVAAAVRWARSLQLSACVVAPADTSAGVPARLCRTHGELGRAWRALRRTAQGQDGSRELVVQEAVPGLQYLVHSTTVPSPGGPWHEVTEIWSETRTVAAARDCLDWVPRHGLLFRALTYAVTKGLRALGVEQGRMRCRIAYAPGRGPVLLSCRPDAEPLLPCPAGLHAMRVSLRPPPADGYLNDSGLRSLTALPTMSHLDSRLHPGAPVERRTSPGEVLLRGGRRAVEADYRALRALERRGALYAGAAQ